MKEKRTYLVLRHWRTTDHSYVEATSMAEARRIAEEEDNFIDDCDTELIKVEVVKG